MKLAIKLAEYWRLVACSLFILSVRVCRNLWAKEDTHVVLKEAQEVHKTKTDDAGHERLLWVILCSFMLFGSPRSLANSFAAWDADSVDATMMACNCHNYEVVALTCSLLMQHRPKTECCASMSTSEQGVDILYIECLECCSRCDRLTFFLVVLGFSSPMKCLPGKDLHISRSDREPHCLRWASSHCFERTFPWAPWTCTKRDDKVMYSGCNFCEPKVTAGK